MIPAGHDNQALDNELEKLRVEQGDDITKCILIGLACLVALVIFVKMNRIHSD